MGAVWSLLWANLDGKHKSIQQNAMHICLVCSCDWAFRSAFAMCRKSVLCECFALYYPKMARGWRKHRRALNARWEKWWFFYMSPDKQFGTIFHKLNVAHVTRVRRPQVFEMRALLSVGNASNWTFDSLLPHLDIFIWVSINIFAVAFLPLVSVGGQAAAKCEDLHGIQQQKRKYIQKQARARTHTYAPESNTSHQANRTKRHRKTCRRSTSILV